MAKTRLSAATYVEHGYGQVEPNHLSAQRTAQIYAQLPAAATIKTLENGQFVKYNYAAGVCDYEGLGEWMLVFNEVKLYRDHLGYDDFAMKAEDYVARVYSLVDGVAPASANARDYRGVVASADPYEPTSTENPFVIETFTAPKMMPTDTAMVPRVFKTNIGDIFTTNLVNTTVADTLTVGTLFTVGANGILTEKATPDRGEMVWQLVKKYTLPDGQVAGKFMRLPDFVGQL